MYIKRENLDERIKYLDKAREMQHIRLLHFANVFQLLFSQGIK